MCIIYPSILYICDIIIIISLTQKIIIKTKKFVQSSSREIVCMYEKISFLRDITRYSSWGKLKNISLLVYKNLLKKRILSHKKTSQTVNSLWGVAKKKKKKKMIGTLKCLFIEGTFAPYIQGVCKVRWKQFLSFWKKIIIIKSGTKATNDNDVSLFKKR